MLELIPGIVAPRRSWRRPAADDLRFGRGLSWGLLLTPAAWGVLGLLGWLILATWG